MKKIKYKEIKELLNKNSLEITSNISDDEIFSSVKTISNASDKDLSKIKISKIFQANSKYDAIIILTDWDEFNLKLRNHKARVFDGRQLLNKNETFYTIGN